MKLKYIVCDVFYEGKITVREYVVYISIYLY